MKLIGTLLSLCLILLITTPSLKAQEQLGLRTDNYSGVNSLMLNPANFLSGSLDWDVNIVGAGVFGETSYGFIHNTNVFDIIRKFPNVDGAFDYDDENQFPDDMLITDFYDTNRKKYYLGMITVLGPSFSMKLKGGQTFGVFTSFRAASSSQDIPPSLNFYFWDRTPYYEKIDVSPVKGGAMAWAEFGLNYGKRFETYNGYIDLAASVKLLQGFEGFYFQNKSRVNVTQIPNDTVLIEGSNIEYGLTTSNATTNLEDKKLTPNGIGMGFDLGLVYVIDGDYDTYQWKFGFGILDIGKIQFNQNAEKHVVKTDQSYQLNKRDYLEFTEADQAVKLFSYQALGDSTASLDGRSFGMWLPGAISMQADYAFTPNIFINGLIIQRLGYKKAAVERGNLLAITPRFEHRWFGASLPISLYNYEEFNVGASVRLGFLTIGTENLGSYFKKSDFTGSDIYFAVKVNPFELNFEGRAIRGSRNRGKKAKCYKF
jgi:Family of unknown function (DUF5723)